MKMYKRNCCIIFFSFFIGIVNAQVPSKYEFWTEYVVALKADSVHDVSVREKAAALKRQQEIDRTMGEIANCLHRPYAASRVEEALGKIDNLRKDSALTDTHKEKLDKLTVLVQEYEKKANEFCDIFVSSIEDERFYVLAGQSKLTPGQVSTMANILETAYIKRGLDKLDFAPGYVWLNGKLHFLREAFKELKDKNQNNVETMYDKLTQAVKVESEISESHQSYFQWKRNDY